MRVTKEMVDKWVDLYKSGGTLSGIARKFRFSSQTVYAHLDKVGILRKQTVITNKMIKEWIALYKTGNANCSWIARKYNVSRDTVSSYLKMYGVKTSRNVPHIVEERI